MRFCRPRSGGLAVWASVTQGSLRVAASAVVGGGIRNEGYRSAIDNSSTTLNGTSTKTNVKSHWCVPQQAGRQRHLAEPERGDEMESRQSMG